MEVYIGVDGYTTPNGFIVKEMCIMFPDEEYNYFLFKPPTNLHLTEADQRTIRYATTHLNNLSYHDGDVPYEFLQEIISKYRQYNIYTYSEVAMKLLQKTLSTSVITNIQNMGYKMPSTLPDPACFRKHNPRYCGKAKAIAVKNFLKNRF